MQDPKILLAALALLAAPAAKAQIPRNNPLVDAAHGIAAHGLGTETLGLQPDSTFTAKGDRSFVKEWSDAIAHEKPKAAELEKGIRTVMDAYERGAQKMGVTNDPAAALAFAIEELYAYDHGQEVDRDSFLVLIPRLRAVLAKVDATDRQKQQMYEYALCCAGSVMTYAAGAEDDAAKAKAKNLAELLLEALTGAKPNAIALNGENVAIGAVAETSPPTPTAKDEPTAKSEANGGNVVGEWRWLSTGSVTNWNTTTGAYAGAGRGMTKHYVFLPNGTFKQDALIQVNNSGHASTAYITAEGRYTIQGGRIGFTIVKGHVHGEDNMISSGNYDRPMPESTMRSISETLPYSVRKVDGKLCFILHLGADAKSDMVFRTLAK